MYAEVVDEADVQFARRVDRKALASVTREMSQVSNVRALWALATQWLVIAACFAAVVVVDQLPASSLQGVSEVGKQISTRQSILPLAAFSLSTRRLWLL